jgi:arginase
MPAFISHEDLRADWHETGALVECVLHGRPAMQPQEFGEKLLVSRPRLCVIGAPSSAGAYAPGQERAPAALREAGLLGRLRASGVDVHDLGDTESFRWQVDRNNPRAMNASAVARAARSTARLVEKALGDGCMVLVLGGDCTVELGTVAGALRSTEDVGLVYIDLDTDLNTPVSTTDGALDWMGVAHMLGVADTLEELVRIGPRAPLLRSDQLFYFAVDNVGPFERQLIRDLKIEHVTAAQVAAEPTTAAERVVNGWARKFTHLLIHLDVDVLDFVDMPLAENVRRNVGLKFGQLVAALRVFLSAPNWTALTVCELNPDHGPNDGSTMAAFVAAVSDAIAAAPRFQRDLEADC